MARSHLDQMVVVPFLFYSGVGIMKSIQAKGNDYVQGIMRKRFPKVWFEFFIAVVVFLLVNMITGKNYPLKHIVLAFTGWTAIGNSNWYILGILLLYLATFIAFTMVKDIKITDKRDVCGNLILTALVLCIVFILKIAGKQSYYYNTLIVYSLGCWYVLFQEKIEQFVMKNHYSYIYSFIIMCFVYCMTFLVRWKFGIIGYTAWGIAFVIMMLLVTMKIQIKSKVLDWFGNHVFSVYIMQRIPMIMLEHIGVTAKYPYMSVIMAFVLTIMVSMIFENIVKKVSAIMKQG